MSSWKQTMIPLMLKLTLPYRTLYKNAKKVISIHFRFNFIYSCTKIPITTGLIMVLSAAYFLGVLLWGSLLSEKNLQLFIKNVNCRAMFHNGWLDRSYFIKNRLSTMAKSGEKYLYIINAQNSEKLFKNSIQNN